MYTVLRRCKYDDFRDDSNNDHNGCQNIETRIFRAAQTFCSSLLERLLRFYVIYGGIPIMMANIHIMTKQFKMSSVFGIAEDLYRITVKVL